MPARQTKLAGNTPTREHLVDTAISIIAERGYQALSVPMLAKANGVTTAEVGRHFRSKAELLEAILHTVSSHAQPRPELVPDGSQQQRLSGAADRILDALTENRRVITALDRDPVVGQDPGFVLLVEGARERLLHASFGSHPDAGERAAFYLATGVVHLVPELERLVDEEFVAALRPAVLHALGLATGPARCATADAAGVLPRSA